MDTTQYPEQSKPRKTWSTLGAAALTICGVAAICLPFAAAIGLMVVLSWALIIAGIGHLVTALRFKSVGNFIWEFVLAAACIYLGLYMRMHPVMGMSTLVVVVAIYFLVSACSEFILYFKNPSLPNRGWILAHAVLDLILFVLVWIHWPTNSQVLIGMLVGIDLLAAGLSRLVSDAPFYHSPSRSVSAGANHG